jgi:hypothetical protein
MIQMRTTMKDSHHQEKVEESIPQAQYDKGCTMRNVVKARIRVKVQLVVLMFKIIMVRGGIQHIMDKWITMGGQLK